MAVNPPARAQTSWFRTARVRWILRATLVVLSVALSLGLGEVAVRWFVPAPELVRFQQLDARLQGGERHQFVGLIENDPETFWKLQPNLTLPNESRPFFGLVSNSQGLREEADFGPKSDGEVRILFLGDSCIYGYGLDASETISVAVEDRLRSRFSDCRIECINAGVPGYTLFQGYQQLQTVGYRLEPDLVILSFGWNDSDGWDGRSDIDQYLAFKAARPAAPLRWSRLCQLAATALASQSERPTQKLAQTRLSPSEFSELIDTIQQETESRGIGLLLLVPGSRATVQAFARRGAEADCTPYQRNAIRVGSHLSFGPYDASGHIDGLAVLVRMLKSHSIDDLFLDGVHPTGIANKELAHAVAHKIEPWLREKIE